MREAITVCSFSWMYRHRLRLIGLLALLGANCVFSKDPRNNFCRRYAHQTTVIDDKLYIDGGWVNFDGYQQHPVDSPNTWLGYHDLNNTVIRGGDPWPDLNISLSKNDSIPTVHGGVLWGDAVNKRFYVYGGAWTGGFAEDTYKVLGYDILYDKWDDFGTPNLKPSPRVAAYGAGVGVSETGYGYYYGGWVSNASMSGWGTQPQMMSSNFYTYAYDTNTFTQAATPDAYPRAEGAMVWIPAGDSLGLLVYMGGLVTYDNSTTSPQKFDEIFLFDAKGNSWSNQTATGEIPQNRRQFCMDVAWAPDKSSFNIYLWGGHSVPPPDVNATSFNDIYILSLPSFTWAKAFPDHYGNATLPPEYDHYSASCNMIKSMSQLFVIGGKYTDTDACDLAYDAWALHNFWTGTSQNAGDNKTYWALYDPNVTSNVVPVDVYTVVGGDKNGGATLQAPLNGFDRGNELMGDLLSRRPVFGQRAPTRDVNMDSSGGSNSSKLSTGAIVGIVIGSVAGFVLLLSAWYCIGKTVLRRREERRRDKPNPTSSTWASTAGGSSIAETRMSVVSQPSYRPWGTASTDVTTPPIDQVVPVELTGGFGTPGELPSNWIWEAGSPTELPTQGYGK